MAIEIEERLENAGYHMLGDNDEIEELILSILKQGDLRYLKALLFLFYKYELDIHRVYEKTEKKELLNIMLGIANKIFLELGIERSLPYYTNLNKRKEDKLVEELDDMYGEFRSEFELQLKNEKKPSLFINKQKFDEERELQYSLSQLFTKKEKKVIKRLLENNPVSKTDYEYFSRKTKKKLQAIVTLSDFARALYNKTPKCNEELFQLKSLLEERLLSERKASGKIKSYHVLNEKIVLGSTNEDGETAMTILPLEKVSKEIIHLLQRHPKHDFG